MNYEKMLLDTMLIWFGCGLIGGGVGFLVMRYFFKTIDENERMEHKK